jgi:hypothetical protein
VNHQTRSPSNPVRLTQHPLQRSRNSHGRQPGAADSPPLEQRLSPPAAPSPAPSPLQRALACGAGSRVSPWPPTESTGGQPTTASPKLNLSTQRTASRGTALLPSTESIPVTESDTSVTGFNSRPSQVRGRSRIRGCRPATSTHVHAARLFSELGRNRSRHSVGRGRYLLRRGDGERLVDEVVKTHGGRRVPCGGELLGR